MKKESIKSWYYQIPRSVKLFLLKALILFTFWQLLYHLWLKPIRVPDRFFTNITAACTADVLSWFYKNTGVELDNFKNTILIEGQKAIGIADPCNALEIFVLYIGFLICFPASNKRRVGYGLAGLPIIFVINILRCVGLSLLNLYHRDWVDISHHYIFTTIIYSCVFYLWVLFSKQTFKNETQV